jgi:hypothetical protein
MWVLALVVTFSAVHVMEMAYQVDNMQAQYTSLIDQQQTMGAEVSSLTTPYALERDAARFHVVLRAPLNPRPAVSNIRRHQSISRSGPLGLIGRIFSGAQRALVGK